MFTHNTYTLRIYDKVGLARVYITTVCKSLSRKTMVFGKNVNRDRVYKNDKFNYLNFKFSHLIML